MQKFALKLSLYLTGLILLLFFFRAFVFPYPDKVISRKFSMLSLEKQHINTLFFGPSTIEMHYDPLLYDSLLSAEGKSSTSFNFGISAMVTPENQYVLEKILSLDLPRLKFLLLEVNGLRTVDVEALKETETVREIEMTDVKRALQRARLLNLHFESTADRWEAVKTILSSMITRFSGYGAIDNYVYVSLANQRSRKNNFRIENGYMVRGFKYYEVNPDSVPRYKKLQKYFTQPASQKAYLQQIKELDLQREQAAITPVDKSIADIYEEMIRQCNSKGIRVILIVSSVANGKVSGLVKELQQRKLSVDIIDFMSPEKYPEFYDVRNRADGNHLSYPAAELATRELAKEVLKILNRD